MSRFFASAEQVHGDKAFIQGSDAAHIARVLRMTSGDVLTLCDGDGQDRTCRIVSVTPERIDLSVLSCTDCENESRLKLTLFMALPKGDKLEYVIQKCVELGAYAIVPFISSRCVVKLSDKDAIRKTERWQRVAYEAAKQCGRGMIPKVSEPISFSEMTAQALAKEKALFCFEGEEQISLKDALGAEDFESIAVIIGPEGGFSLDEAAFARSAGLIPVSLGKRILRCETAPICAISAIMYHTDNL